MLAFSCLGDPDIRHMTGASGHLAGSTTAVRGFCDGGFARQTCDLASAARPSRLNDGILLD
jgi:hypothetical protein